MSTAPEPITTGHARSTSQVPRVLIVEDELLVAWHLESLAREQNLEVCGLVPDGDGAIEQATDLDADLILMDIRLAGRMDGIEAARRIREQRDTPIIFITAHGDPATRAKIEQVLPALRCWRSRSPPPSSKRRSPW
jgi:CheY-like chemotaxis protein